MNEFYSNIYNEHITLQEIFWLLVLFLTFFVYSRLFFDLLLVHLPYCIVFRSTSVMNIVRMRNFLLDIKWLYGILEWKVTYFTHLDLAFSVWI